MLDDTLGPAGPLIGRGRVVRRGRNVAYLAGDLSDPDGRQIATAIATATVRRPG